MARVEVDGGWADIRDPRKLTGRQSEPMDDAQYALMGLPGMAALGSEGLKAMRTLRQETVIAYVEAWSEGSRSNGGGGISHDMLLDAPVAFVTAVENAITVVVKATGRAGVDTEPTPDPATPTSPSSV